MSNRKGRGATTGAQIALTNNRNFARKQLDRATREDERRYWISLVAMFDEALALQRTRGRSA